jgi:hypothetical protein
VTTIELGDALAEEIETLCAALGLVAAPASATTTTTPPALLSAYATALRRLCAAQTPALTEAEAVVGRALAPLPAKDPRRRAASAREVEAATGALTTWARRQVGDAETALAIWRYARAEGRRWGARSLAVLCVGMVLDKVAELRASRSLCSSSSRLTSSGQRASAKVGMRCGRCCDWLRTFPLPFRSRWSQLAHGTTILCYGVVRSG